MAVHMTREQKQMACRLDAKGLSHKAMGNRYRACECSEQCLSVRMIRPRVRTGRSPCEEAAG
jgi:hypothetical protein